MTKLDEIALNIELVLISIIEGVALVMLAENATPIMHNTASLQYIPYVLAGLSILLVFWSQAILHAVSFIRWPLRMEHMFLYFLAAFVQVVAYSSITDITAWFFWWSVFSLLAILIYVVDLRIIRDAAPHLKTLPEGATFVSAVERRHLYELKVLVPIALVFNVIAWGVTLIYPSLFLNPLVYSILGLLQFLISLGALIDCMKNFKSRSAKLQTLFG